jgi:hypothetical protein
VWRTGLATRRGSEWELIKKSPVRTRLMPQNHFQNVLHKSCQNHVVTGVLLTLGARLKRLRSKVEANMEEHGPKQGPQTPTRSSGTNLRITLQPTVPYRVIRPLPSDDPGSVPGHPGLTSGSPWTAQKTARETTPNFRSMDLPNHLEFWEEILERWWTPHMPQKFWPIAPYNSRYRESWPRTLWTRVHLNINESKAKSRV